MNIRCIPMYDKSPRIQLLEVALLASKYFRRIPGVTQANSQALDVFTLCRYRLSKFRRQLVVETTTGSLSKLGLVVQMLGNL
jgi:hypothetical protein